MRFQARLVALGAGIAGACLFVSATSATSRVNATLARSAPAMQRAVQQRLAARRFSARMTSTPAPCSTSSPGSFVGIPAANYADGSDAAVVAGYSNDACGPQDAIVAGYVNRIGGPSATQSLIGAGTYNAISNTLSFVGAGSSNVITGNASIVGAGTGNVVDGGQSAILSGQGNDAGGDYTAVVAGLNNGSSNIASFVGAGEYNSASGYGSVVVGGDYNYGNAGNAPTTPGNQASGTDSFVGAGDVNVASGFASTIVGGQNNTSSAMDAFVGSGATNSISASASYASILGGNRNAVSGEYASIIGGFGNAAAGSYAIVAGGDGDSAAGTLTFAAGYHAGATHNGSFVWSDYSSGSAVIKDTAVNQFVARASGGFHLYSNEGATSGVLLGPGSGTWASLSDRNAKTDIAPLDDDAVLAKVAALPVNAWRYKSEFGVRHVGPMAQDFYAAFGVGADNRHITSIDEDGVALAAIKALHGNLTRIEAGDRRKDGEIAVLRSRLAATEARDAAIERRLDALTARR